MHCPECGGEYRRGIETCPTCEVGLVELSAEPERAQPPRPLAAESLVDLVGFVDEIEGRDARLRLRAARIPCELVIRDAPGTDWSDDVVEECWIRVPTTRVRAAAELLGLEIAVHEDACPSCGAPMKGEECRRCGLRFES